MVNLSKINPQELLNSQYLIFKNRCFVQLKKEPSEYKETETLGEDFGLAILTLQEALQTFKNESQLFKLQLKPNNLNEEVN